MEKKEKTYFNISGMAAVNCRRISEKTRAFDLKGNGLNLRSLKIVEGANGVFIAPPAHLGKDGKWYDDYSVYFTEEDTKRIINRVNAALGKKEKEEENGEK